MDIVRRGSETRAALRARLPPRTASEYLVIGVPLALSADRPADPYGVVTRAGAQRVKRRVLGSTGGPTMAPTEES